MAGWRDEQVVPTHILGSDTILHDSVMVDLCHYRFV